MRSRPLWIAIGLGGFATLSLAVGLAVAAILGTINRDVSELHEELLEDEAWTTRPLSRANTSTANRDEHPRDTGRQHEALRFGLWLLDHVALELLERETEALREDDTRLDRIFALIGELRAETRNVLGSLEQTR